jgi:hypothetical protein
MISEVVAVYELNVITDDPRFEGLALEPAPSILGRESLDNDLTPGFADAEENIDWQQPRLAARWVPPRAIGRVTEFNDYPGVDMTLPAFSSRAVDILRDLLEPHGEILPLQTQTDMKYFFYNILTISDALDRSASKCNFWSEPPTTATNIDFFAINPAKLNGAAIFRLRELPMSVMVTNEFVGRAEFFGLNGFCFTKVWPLQPGVNWRKQKKTMRSKSSDGLKRQTLVVMLPLSDTPVERSQIAAFEDSIDRKLKPVQFSVRYFGCYEGHDTQLGEYRMFFSCPDTDELFNVLKTDIEALKWSSPVTVCRRYGRMYDAGAREEIEVV